MRHIHFSVCGIGLGHASRCKPLILESIRRGVRVTVSTYGDAVDYFERYGISVLRVPGLDYGRTEQGEVSIKATLLKNLFLPLKVMAQTLIEAQIIEESEADAILADTRASAVLASRITGVPSILIINQYNVILQKDRLPGLSSFFEDFINSFTIAWSLSDSLLIADYPPPLTISRDNLVMRDKDERRVEYIGPMLEKIPSDYQSRAKIKERMGLDPSLPLVAIIPTGPRPDRARFIEIITPLLLHLKDLQIIMTGVRGGLGVSRGDDRLRLVEWYDDEYELLGAADVVVTRAGQTLTAKALAFKCRLVLIPIPRQTEQESNAKSLTQNRVAVTLKEGEVSAESLKQAIKNALDRIDDSDLQRYSRFVANVKPVERVLELLLRR
ncbi:MAG: glycosyltransferase family protein [Nitrososphaerota archaeon]